MSIGLSSLKVAFPDAHVFNFVKRNLNFAVSRDPQLKHCEVVFGSMSNFDGIYMQSHCCSKFRTVTYYATKPGTEVTKSPQDTVW